MSLVLGFRQLMTGVVIGLSTSIVLAAAPKKPTATAVVPTDGGVLLDESLAAEHGPGWRKAKGDWKFADGAWQGAEIEAEKHGAVARHNVTFTDAVIEFDVKLDGAKAVSLSINDPKGHNSRLGITPAGLRLTKDDHDHAGPDKAAVLATLAVKLEAGKWQHVRIEQKGESFTAQVGEHRLEGKHAEINQPKSNIGLTVSGETASFKNLRVTALPAAK
jgi:hypothetical protein